MELNKDRFNFSKERANTILASVICTYISLFFFGMCGSLIESNQSDEIQTITQWEADSLAQVQREREEAARWRADSLAQVREEARRRAVQETRRLEEEREARRIAALPEISALRLLSIYNNNEVRFNMLHGNKEMIVTGSVSRVSEDYFYFDDNIVFGWTEVKCNFDVSQHSRIAQLDRESRVRVRGIVREKTSGVDINIDNCKLM